MRIKRSTVRSVLVMLLLNCGAAPAFAWTQLGHAIVGDLAEQQLSRDARRQVSELLAGEPQPTLGGVASWADALRYSDAPRFRATEPWHYINAKGGGCGFDVKRDCADGNCLVVAIETQLRILGDRSQPLAARRDALKFVVHLMGDLHQPLHAGNRTDKGGNDFQVSLRTHIAPESYARDSYRDGVMGTNLHSIWDFYVLTSAGRNRQQYVTHLSSRALRAVAKPAAATPMSWAKESCAQVTSQQLYPDSHVMDHRYLDAKREFAERRLGVAATRLAAVLNGVFATP